VWKSLASFSVARDLLEAYDHSHLQVVVGGVLVRVSLGYLADDE
jgi:hypothetical protein